MASDVIIFILCVCLIFCLWVSLFSKEREEKRHGVGWVEGGENMGGVRGTELSEYNT